jgi:hypothetical protein
MTKVVYGCESSKIIVELQQCIAIHNNKRPEYGHNIDTYYEENPALDVFVKKCVNEIQVSDIKYVSDLINFWANVIVLLTRKEPITDEEIAKLNKELEGGVGDMVFGR